MQGKRQFRCVVWIINWPHEINCNPRVYLGADKLVSEYWTYRNYRRQITEGYRGCMGFDIAFVSRVNILLEVLKLSNFLCLDPVFPKTKIVCFWFQTMKNDWVWRKVFERHMFVLSVLVDIVGVLFFRLASLFGKLNSKFESFFTE